MTEAIDTELAVPVSARALAGVLRLWPFAFGCGWIANHHLTRRAAGSPDGLVWARVAGWDVLVPIRDHVGAAAYFVGDLDPRVSWVIDRAVLPGDVALDIGANYGLCTVRFARRVGSSGRVHAYECNPAVLDALHRTVARLPTGRVRVHAYGLGSEAGALTLSVVPGNDGRSSLLPTTRRHDACTVCVRRLDDDGLDRCDVVKIDVEGFEAEVLRGGAGTLDRLRPSVILLEEHDREGAISLALLREAGYALYALPRRLFRPALVPLDRAGPAHDYVAVHRDASAARRARLGLA